MHLFQVLLVDSDPVHRRRVRAVLEERHFECFEVADLTASLQVIQQRVIDLVVSELRPPSEDGLTLDLLMRSGAFGQSLPPIILYFDPFQRPSPLLAGPATCNAILIPAPVLAADLDAALDRAFDLSERQPN